MCHTPLSRAFDSQTRQFDYGAVRIGQPFYVCGLRPRRNAGRREQPERVKRRARLGSRPRVRGAVAVYWVPEHVRFPSLRGLG